MSKFFQSNLTLKIISVIIAIILWLYAVSEQNPETTQLVSDIPIDIVNENALADQQMTLAVNPPAKVNIRIRGLVNDIRKVNTANIKAVLDLSSIEKTGTQQVALNVEGLLPREVKLDKIPEISVTVDKIASKTIPLDTRISGSESDGYYRHPAVTEPQSITIYGAESIVENIVKGLVEVKLDKDKSSIKQSLPIKLIDGNGHSVESDYVSLKQQFAMVTIPIYPVKTLAVEPVITGKPAEGFAVGDIEINPSEVTVNGYTSVLDKFDSISTQVIDIQDAVKDVSADVKLESIDGLFLSPGESDQVNVIVRIYETTIEKTLILDDIEFTNIPEGYIPEVISQPVSIRIKGLYTMITPAAADDIRASVDLSGLTEGEYELRLSVAKPDYVQEFSMTSDNVTVRLTLANPPVVETDTDNTTVP